MNYLRLGPILGKPSMFNEVISSKMINEQNFKSNSVTIFFGGDVQDYPEEMSSHRDHGKYVQWNLLNMVTLLSLKFPSSLILIIKPNRMEFKTFSCYDYFVPGNELGTPTYTKLYGAMSHLKNLISNSLVKLRELSKCSFSSEQNVLDNGSDKGTDDKVIQYESINLIGFSKGCVVLNQLITELHTIQTLNEDNENLMEFWKNVRSIYWLDGGHSGGKGTWITNRPILHTLATIPNLSLNIHVTPYQVKDERRPWIGKECKSFVDALKREKADINYKLHFEDDIPSLENHFKILSAFK